MNPENSRAELDYIIRIATRTNLCPHAIQHAFILTRQRFPARDRDLAAAAHAAGVKGDVIVVNIFLPQQASRGTVLIVMAVLTFWSKDASAGSLREEQQCLALSMYWEARGEGRTGMLAVGWTVMNRVHSRHFPATPCEVVHQGGEQPPCQFSWWCDGKSDRPRDRHSWQLALIIAAELLTDPPRDPTGGSLFYHSISIGSPWKRQRVRTALIGGHVFYR